MPYFKLVFTWNQYFFGGIKNGSVVVLPLYPKTKMATFLSGRRNAIRLFGNLFCMFLRTAGIGEGK